MLVFARLNEEKADNSLSLYKMFQTNMSFRYKIVSLLAKQGYVFHGGENQFDSFDADKIKGGTRGVYGYGAYFTNESYKCEEYGNEFVVLDTTSFRLLDTENNGSSIKQTLESIADIDTQIEIAYENINNARNSKEYEYYNGIYNSLKQQKSTIDTFMAYIVNRSIDKNPNMSIDNIRKSIISQSNSADSIDKRFSTLFLSLGFDGFINGNQYVIFNFDKLNQNIVKDIESLIASVI